MNRPTWVLDTNVVVSGLLSSGGPPARLIDAVLSGRLRIAFDDRIEAEYRDVLSRPKFAIPAARREAFLDFLLRNHTAPAAVPRTCQQPPDPDDIPFLEVAAQTADKTLVTGNMKHYPSGCRGLVRVLTPREAWEILRAP